MRPETNVGRARESGGGFKGHWYGLTRDRKLTEQITRRRASARGAPENASREN